MSTTIRMMTVQNGHPVYIAAASSPEEALELLSRHPLTSDSPAFRKAHFHAHIARDLLQSFQTLDRLGRRAKLTDRDAPFVTLYIDDLELTLQAD